MSSSKKDFIAEAEEIIENANACLLELQSGFNPDTLNSLFRALHTMKGLSGLFGLRGITDLSHSLESILDDLRLGKLDFNDDAISFIFSNMDILRGLIVQVSQDKDTDDVSDAIKAVTEFREAGRSKEKGSSADDIGISPAVLKVLSEYEEHRLKSNIKEGKRLYFVKAVYALTDFAPGLENLNTALKSLGEIIATLPVSEGVPEGSIGFNLLFGSDSGTDDIKPKVAPAEVEEISLPKSEEPPPRAPKAPEVSLKSSTNTVRVDIDKLDKILSTVGELVLAKGAVVRIGNELAESVGYTALTLDVFKITQTLDRKLTELQGHILELRMVPFSQIFTRLAQVVRRYTREVKKEIDLELFGEDTEIDKLLAEEIIDPLVHLIRNCIDHGIEPADKRKAAGKKERGTVTLKAFPKGNNVIVSVHDDGAGINTGKILQKAIERNLVPEDEDLERNEVLDLIFLPGLSTKEQISDISGRGVGMDIVKEKLTLFGGFVEVESESGEGTTFTLTLPITLAIVKALIVSVGNEMFAIPLTSISETFIVQPSKIQTIEEREVIEIRGEMLPLLRVARVFGLEETAVDEYFAVVIGFAGKRLGLLVDTLSEQTEIIIKPLGEHLKGIRGLAGAAEVGRHEIILVLDVEAMMEESFSGKKKTSRAASDIKT
ncbi:MAG TPA: chemotaxis protein CheA [Nitrospirae bacterium]|nr:chemotaxis protein CheA [bacterium BMS3Abin10]GBE38732.1 chemotaxis protein CheA [bacterium BMS3Bbin08]HDH51483.1 chemotaxis protein CheA [Nitrospirota bacterium]HDK16601.1 chemotaxis protein CheA [Nitrospirota bacterium]HDK41708.1 chemotaxis protein CheA [Nitrospirota bacterium]